MPENQQLPSSRTPQLLSSMATVKKVIDSIVILDDDDAEQPSSSSHLVRPQAFCVSSTSGVPQPPSHIPQSPFASARKESHVLKLENEKLFGEFVEHCLENTREHPEVMDFLRTKYSKASPDFLSSVEFRNAVGRCLTRAQAQTTKTFVYINELCTLLKQHSAKRRVTFQPPNAKQKEKNRSQGEAGGASVDVSEDASSRQPEDGEEKRKTKRASRRQIAYLENLLKVYSDEIRRLQERELNLDDLEKEDSSYLQEHKLKRKMIKIYDKLCELKDCSTLTGRVIEQRIRYSSTRYPEINKKIERFINSPEARQNPPDFRDILQVVRRANERSQLMLSRKQEVQISQEVFRETGNKLQERRHLDMVYNFGSHLTDFYKPTADPALTDHRLAQKLRSNRELALSSLEEVINKYAHKQDDTEEEERRKRLDKEKQKKESAPEQLTKTDTDGENQQEPEEDAEEDEEEEEEDDESSDPDIEEEIQASAAQVGPDEEDDEEDHLSVSDEVMQPSSEGSNPMSPSAKSPVCGDAGESSDEVPSSAGRTHGDTPTESPEDKPPDVSPPSSNGCGHAGVPSLQEREGAPLDSPSCQSADSNSVDRATEIPPATEDRVSTPLMNSEPDVTNETANSRKRKRESKKNHVVQNGNIGHSGVSDISVDVSMDSSPVQVDSTRADTPTQDLVSSSRYTPPPKKHKVNVATQCDPDEVIVLSDSD